MNTQPEALRLADELEAMFGKTDIDERVCKELRRLHEENKSLRQALAMERFSEVNQEIEEALKQPKREWVELTDEFIWGIKMKGRDLECVSRSALMRFAREIEAASKEKNT